MQQANPKEVSEPPATSKAVEVRDLWFSYRHKSRKIEALQNVSIAVEDGEFVSVVGPSGCGKSTLLKLIGGLLEIDHGEILVKGKHPDEARLSRDYGFVFQNPVLLPWHTVIKNICLPLSIFGWTKSQQVEAALPLIELVGLSEFKNAYPRQLSGGMQQRVSLARALSFHPSVLLMDEPFGSLDEITRQKLNFELLRIWRRVEATVLFVTHNVLEAAFLSDRVVVLSRRPGQVNGVIDIDLPRPRDLRLTAEPAFLELVSRVRTTLGVEGGA
jgi:NitT/TauT family transport system ATP-binding protein